MKTKKIGICKYCGQNKELCDAHILPKKFYIDYRNKKYQEVDIVSRRKKQRQNGYWDDSILCSDCDKICGKYDEEAYRVLQTDLRNHKSEDKTAYFFSNNDFDYKKFRFFFISLIWRASITRGEVFKLVNLCEYEDIALHILKEDIADDESLFKVIVLREPDGHKYDSVVFVEKLEFAGRTSYKFFFNQFIVLIIPTLKNAKWTTVAIYERLFLKKNEFIILEDTAFLKEKFDFISYINNKKLS